MFACGLKDIGRNDVSKVEEIVFSTLREISESGIDPDLIESAVHQIEFHRKEITNTPYPFGIKLLLSFAGPLIHDADPVSCINIDADLDRLKKEIQAGRFLESRIRTHFLDNPHRVLFTLAPDPELESQQVEKTKQQLKKRLEGLTDKDLDQLRKDAAALKALQETEEDLSVLPTLALADVPPDVVMIHPDRIPKCLFPPAMHARRPTFSISPARSARVTSLRTCSAWCRFSARHSPTAEPEKTPMKQWPAAWICITGGVSVTPFSGSYFSKEASAHSFLALQGKALERNIVPMFDLISEFVLRYSLDDLERLKSLLLQYQAGMEASIVSTGHRYAISLASRHLSTASQINEMWHGIAQYKTIRKLQNS